MTKTVVIADDSASVRQIVSMVLKTNGFTVLEGENGEQALKHLDGKKVNLIISDVNMPVMDGLTFVKEVRKMEAYQFTPILMLTTETDANLKAQAKEQGVRAWLVKPFQPQLLLKSIAMLT